LVSCESVNETHEKAPVTDSSLLFEGGEWEILAKELVGNIFSESKCKFEGLIVQRINIFKMRR
jgi:hypothetical protein